MKQVLTVCGVVLFLVGAILFSCYVWPTKYRYDRFDDAPARIHRVTGDAERLTGYGWRPLKPPRKSAEEILGIPTPTPAQAN